MQDGLGPLDDIVELFCRGGLPLELPEVGKECFLDGNEISPKGALIDVRFLFEMIGDHVVDVFDEDDVSLQVIQV